MKRVIFYHNDADGRCAAAIAWRHAKEHGWKTAFAPFEDGDPMDWQIFEHFKTDVDTLWILDFAFEPEVMAKIREIAGSNLVWIDHHVENRDLFERFKDVEGIRKDDVAACILTWNYCYGNIDDIPSAVIYIGDRDVWVFDGGDITRFFYEAFLQENTEPWQGCWDRWLNKKYDLSLELAKGRVIYRARMKWLQDMAKRLGRENDEIVSGVATLTVNFPGSGDMGHIIQDLGFEIAHCYEDKPNRDGKVVRLHHVYSGTVDVGAIAKERGGGGRKAAAGWEESIEDRRLKIPAQPDFSLQLQPGKVIEGGN